jgi:carboxylesterase type B
MRADWTSFAERGVPSSTSGAAWGRFTSSDQHARVLAPPAAPTEVDFGAVHHRAFWARVDPSDRS